MPALEAAYAGDEACASCHEDLYASYHRTGMGRSVSLFDASTAPERFDPDGLSPLVCHESTGYCYQAFTRGDTLYQRETRPDSPDWLRVHAASHVVGSGHATRSYFMTVSAPGGGYVTEMPLTWYVERGVWDLSPGYHNTNPRFARPINAECMGCHNGPTSVAPGTQNFFHDVPLGITCERCHGPGAEHIDARLEGSADSSIVNPARLNPEHQLSACQQCHLSGTTVFAPGADPYSFRPGQDLTSNRRVFVRAEQIDDPERFGISSHGERLMRSACFEASRRTSNPMTCTTCHDPHVPTAEMAADHFNDACLSCHGAASEVGQSVMCTRPGIVVPHDALTGDCVSCHLRRSGTSDIPHVTFTDHWIRRRVPAPATTEPSSSDTFVRERPFDLVDITAREAGDSSAGAENELAGALASFMFYDSNHRLPAYLPRVVATIRRARAAGARHPVAPLYLGRALLAMDSTAAAEAALREAIKAAPEDPLPRYWLGRALLARGDAAGAVATLSEAVRLQPLLVEARQSLAEALVAAGRIEGALAELRQAVALNPVHHPGVWNDLGFLLLRLGRGAEGVPALERAVNLDPRLAEAQANLGAALLARDDAAGAARRLEAALRMRPDYGPALGNLGVAYARLGRTEDARRQFRRVLELNPGDRQAAAYLAELDASP